jgi:hypothetical protein
VDYVFFVNSNARCLKSIGDEILAPWVVTTHDGFAGKGYYEVTFEVNPLSTAYVSPKDHVKYYGARFLGATTTNFLHLCTVLDRNTQIDESNKYIARWHDESHWNWFVNEYLDLNPEVRTLGVDYHVPEEVCPPSRLRYRAELTTLAPGRNLSG